MRINMMYLTKGYRASDMLHLFKELKVHGTYLAAKWRCNVFFVKHKSEK